MSISIDKIELKKEELTKDFKDLTDKLKDIEAQKTQVTNQALAVNGAIQACQQLIDENKESENDGNEKDS
jgi:septal ring factor EnvC (AmiA/AmiB activator)